MGSEQDDVLPIHQLSDENGEFSGFSPVLSSEGDEGIRPLSLGKVSKKTKSKPKKTKSTLNKENAQASTSAAGSKTQSSASVASAFDISKLSQLTLIN